MKQEEPKFETERLRLRFFELSDAERVRELAGDKAISDTTLHIPYPYEKGMAEEWISTHRIKFESGESIHFAIILKTTDELIGAVGLIIDKGSNRAELGYWIGKEYWNRGYCTEAAGAIVDYGFGQLFLRKITASHFSGNLSSGKVMSRIGMKEEGCLRKHVAKNSKFEDLVVYGILREEWEGEN